MLNDAMRYLWLVIATFCMSTANAETLDRSEIIKKISDSYGIGLIHQDYSHPANPFRYDDIDGGLVIRAIALESSAYQAGLKIGWVILSVDGQSLQTDGQRRFYERLQDNTRPDELSLVVFDGARSIEVTVTRSKKRYSPSAYSYEHEPQ